MKCVYYAKVWFFIEDKTNVTELFLTADSYTAAVQQIEESFKNDLCAFQLYCIDSDYVYLDDLDDWLDEARGIFGGTNG